MTFTFMLFSVAGVIITHFPLLQLLFMFACYSIKYLSEDGLVITWITFLSILCAAYFTVRVGDVLIMSLVVFGCK